MELCWFHALMQIGECHGRELRTHGLREHERAGPVLDVAARRLALTQVKVCVRLVGGGECEVHVRNARLQASAWCVRLTVVGAGCRRGRLSSAERQ